MSSNQLPGDGFSPNLAGMSKNQLYDIMHQMKTMIEQNRDQAKEILVQNPQLTRVLFQAQILLGMVKPAQPTSNAPPTASVHAQQSVQPPQRSNAQAAATLSAAFGLQDQVNASQAPNPVRMPNQPVMPVPSPSVPSVNSHSKPLPSHPLQPVQQTRGHFNAQSNPMSVPQSNQIPKVHQPQLHHISQQPSLLQHPRSTVSTQSQQLFQATGAPHMQLQPSQPPQGRPTSVPAFNRQNNPQMGPYGGYQHSGAPQVVHQSQPMFHSGQNQPASLGSSFSQGHPPLPAQQRPQSLYQGGGSHSGMEFRQTGSSTQGERGSTWIPGLQENTTGTQQLQAPAPPFIPGLMGSNSQPSQSPTITPDVETALLQQVMSLTPEQINLLPPDQKNQVLQLQQMLRR